MGKKEHHKVWLNLSQKRFVIGVFGCVLVGAMTYGAIFVMKNVIFTA